MRKLFTSILLLCVLTALVTSQTLLGGGARVGGQGVVRRAAAGGGSSTLNTSLVGYWKFDESSGDAADSSGAGLTLTNNNTATFGTGKVGNAAYLSSASSQFFSRASSSALQFGGSKDWSFVAWIYMTTDTGNIIVTSKDNDTSGQREFVLFMRDGPNRLSVEHFTATDVSAFLDAATFGLPSVSTWYLLVITYTNSSDALTFSVNAGTRDTSTVVLQAPSTAEFRVGGRQYPGFLNPWNGRIDEVGKWDKALTTTEEACLYNGGSGTTWPFTGLCT